MTTRKNKLIPGLSALASVMISAQAFAGFNGLGDVPAVIKGEAAAVDPFTIHTHPGGSQPFAFADFPDLPGRLPPPKDDKITEPEVELDTLGSGYVAFNLPKRHPPSTGQTFDLPIPQWEGDVLAPWMPRSADLDPGFNVPVRRLTPAPAVPAPASALLVIAGAAAASRRRR